MDDVDFVIGVELVLFLDKLFGDVDYVGVIGLYGVVVEGLE